jgi:hypothetical protein
MNEYDEIKKLLKRARLLQEQTEVNNIAKSIERSASDIESSSKDVDVDEVKKEKSKTYRISGGLITLHGKN